VKEIFVERTFKSEAYETENDCFMFA